MEDVTLIDGTGSPPRAHLEIAIANGRIQAIGPTGRLKRPPHARVVSGTGRYVIPGLFDTHAHVTFLSDPNNLASYDRATSEQILRILLANGITTVRNPAAPPAEGVKLREDVRTQIISGPRIFTAGDPLDWAEDKSEEEIRTEVGRQAAIGVDYIKVYARMHPRNIEAVISEAHRHNLKVVGHLQETTPTEAVRLGIDAITHGATWSAALLPANKRQLYDQRRRAVGSMRARLDWLEWVDLKGPEITEMIKTVAKARVPLDPTLIAYVTKFRSRDPRYRNSPYSNGTPQPVLKTWQKPFPYWKDEDIERGERLWPKLLQLTKAYYDAGALLMAGSDFPNAFVIPGASIHDEMELLVEAGISPLNVLRIATRDSAEGLGILQDVGTVEAGKRADLVVLEADPVADIQNTRRIRQVIYGGNLLDPSAER